MAKRLRPVEVMDLNQNFWAGRKVLITGHTGFKGGWLTLWLNQLGAQLSGFALAPDTQPSLFECASLRQDIDSHLADIRDPASIAAVVKATQPEVIFHLAAQPLVRASYADPIGTYATNVMGTAHLLDATRQLQRPPAVIVVTSDKCYENRETTHPYTESDHLGGHDPYSSSKACAEIVAASWQCSFPDSAHIATARAGNVIGGGDWASDRLMPDLVRAFQAGDEVRIRSPEALRPWQHVLDPLHGYLLLAQSAAAGKGLGAWNFGPDAYEAWSVARLVGAAASKWGDDARRCLDARPQPHEARLLCLDSGKARRNLGWKPRLRTEAALEWTLDWYRRHRAGDDMRAFTLAQIREFSMGEEWS